MADKPRHGFDDQFLQRQKRRGEGGDHAAPQRPDTADDDLGPPLMPDEKGEGPADGQSAVQTSSLADAVEFAENPEPRCACVLLLDTSGSMAGRPIAALNQGLRTFRESVAQDPLAARRVEVAIITFDSQVTVVQDFVTVDRFRPPTLEARGRTLTGVAVNRALDMLETRKHTYRQNGIAYYRPWAFLITDGEPQGNPPGEVQRAVDRISEAEKNRHVAFFAVGVEHANMDKLRRMVVREPVQLVGLNFSSMFMWLSSSMGRISHSNVGEDMVPLPSPDGWAVV